MTATSNATAHAYPVHTWDESAPGLWRRDDGRYVILRSELPGEMPNLATIYTLRWRESGTARAWGDRWLGTHLGEHHDLTDAQDHAARDDFARATHRANSEALDALPSLVTQRWYLPVSDGLTRDALILTTHDDGHLVARVVGMSRGEWDYEPVTYAEIDVTAALADRNRRRFAYIASRIRHAFTFGATS